MPYQSLRMVGPGSRLINAGGSSMIAEEEERSQWINDSLDLPALDPFGLWFHSDKVKKAAREAIVGKFDKFTPSYKKATPEQREAWWNRFKAQFKYQKFREPEVKDGFEDYCKERLRDLVSRAGTSTSSRSTWMPDSVKEEMLVYRATEEFKNRSAKSKKNRASKGKNGKAPATHTMGRLNAIQYMDKLCNENGGSSLPSPVELMKKSKTRKSGGYVSDEVSEILNTIKKKKEALLETVPEDDIDDNEIYMETVKGFNKKGEVLGLGKATSFYFEKPLPSSAPGTTSYTPGIVSKLSAQNEAIKEELNSIRQWKLELQQSLASQGINITTALCNPNSIPHSDRRSGDDDNEGNGGSGSDFATQILAC